MDKIKIYEEALKQYNIYEKMTLEEREEEGVDLKDFPTFLKLLAMIPLDFPQPAFSWRGEEPALYWWVDSEGERTYCEICAYTADGEEELKDSWLAASSRSKYYESENFDDSCEEFRAWVSAIRLTFSENNQNRIKSQFDHRLSQNRVRDNYFRQNKIHVK